MHNMGKWGQSLLVKWSTSSSVMGHFHASLMGDTGMSHMLLCNTTSVKSFSTLHWLLAMHVPPSHVHVQSHFQFLCCITCSISCLIPYSITQPISNHFGQKAFISSHVKSHIPPNIPFHVLSHPTTSCHLVLLLHPSWYGSTHSHQLNLSWPLLCCRRCMRWRKQCAVPSYFTLKLCIKNK